MRVVSVHAIQVSDAVSEIVVGTTFVVYVTGWTGDLDFGSEHAAGVVGEWKPSDDAQGSMRHALSSVCAVVMRRQQR